MKRYDDDITGGSGNTADATADETPREVAVGEVHTLSLGQKPDQSSSLAEIPGLGPVSVAGLVVGPSSTQSRLFVLQGFNFFRSIPAAILIQPRQGINQNFGFPDVFAVQVIATSTSAILCRVTRLDLAVGWGQDLRLDVFVVQ
jgi:hypothetical protein